jgi:hypothetical protein
MVSSLSKKQQELYELAKEKLARGDLSGLHNHYLSDEKLWSLDFKGSGGGRGSARIKYTEKNGVITIVKVQLTH